MTDYTYIGKQKGIENIPDLQLFNCNRCGTTITLQKQEEHLKNQHYTRWYEIQEKKKTIVAKNYMNYLIGNKNN